MSTFVCLFAHAARRVSEVAKTGAARRAYACNAAPSRWIEYGPFAVLAPADSSGTVAGTGPLDNMVLVGSARLDNREEVARWSGERNWHTRSDIELVLAAVRARGTSCIPLLLGDFAFVVWDAAHLTLSAWRDAIGVRSLFYTTNNSVLALAPRAIMLTHTEEYEREYIAEVLVNGYDTTTRSIFRGVTKVPPGGSISRDWRHGSLREHRFWSVDRFRVNPKTDPGAVEQFRSLFEAAVGQRLTNRCDTWSHLSGGLDSSSVVCTAQSLWARGIVPHGLAGTVTAGDTMGDEREFSAAVVAQYGVANSVLMDEWPWRDDGAAAPLTDDPDPFYPYYARDRRMCATVKEAGGTTLLSGLGSDHYLACNLAFMADLLGSGRVRGALGEAAHWAMAKRRSFWRFAYRNAVYPLLPVRLRLRGIPPRHGIPPWVTPDFARRYDLPMRLREVRMFGGRRGQKFEHAVAFEMSFLPNLIYRGPYEDGIEARYPFLHRPLVEFGLQLPHTARVRAEGRKWILREAMRDVLPERVRTRTGKGTIGARIMWALSHERERIDRLTSAPLLAELGCVDPARLQEAVAAARMGRRVHSLLLDTLALETWLSVRAGQWVVREREGEAVPTFA